MTKEEVCPTPDVVVGTYLLIYVIFRFVYAYNVFYVDAFLVSYLLALMLFDSGASRSFVYLSFSGHVSVRRKVVSRPLRVSIADEHAILATNVFRGCVFEIFGFQFLIDLVPIAMGDVSVIVGMD